MASAMSSTRDCSAAWASRRPWLYQAGPRVSASLSIRRCPSIGATSRSNSSRNWRTSRRARASRWTRSNSILGIGARSHRKTGLHFCGTRSGVLLPVFGEVAHRQAGHVAVGVVEEQMHAVEQDAAAALGVAVGLDLVGQRIGRLLGIGEHQLQGVAGLDAHVEVEAVAPAAHHAAEVGKGLQHRGAGNVAAEDLGLVVDRHVRDRLGADGGGDARQQQENGEGHEGSGHRMHPERSESERTTPTWPATRPARRWTYLPGSTALYFWGLGRIATRRAASEIDILRAEWPKSTWLAASAPYRPLPISTTLR